MHESEKWKWSRSVVSDSSQPHGLQPTRLLCPWDFSRQEYWSELPLPSPENWLLTHKNCWLDLVLSGGWPNALTAPSLSLFLLLINSLPSKMLCVWKFFPNPLEDCLNIVGLPHPQGLNLCLLLGRRIGNHINKYSKVCCGVVASGLQCSLIWLKCKVEGRSS